MKILKIIIAIVLIGYISYRVSNIIGEKVTAINETEHQTMAREMIIEYMEEHDEWIGWEITDNEVVSDNTFYNALDHDKPEGDMRTVWVEGHIDASYEKDQSMKLFYSVQFYKMVDGDDKWYVGTCYGILGGKEYEQPIVTNEQKYSDYENPDGPIPENNILVEFDGPVNEIDQSNEEEVNDWYIELMNLKFEAIQLLNYVEGGKINIVNTELIYPEGSAAFVYLLEGFMTDKFNQLTENEQIDLLYEITGILNIYEFHMGYGLDTKELRLINGADVYKITYQSVEKNNEKLSKELIIPFSKLQ